MAAAAAVLSAGGSHGNRSRSAGEEEIGNQDEAENDEKELKGRENKSKRFGRQPNSGQLVCCPDGAPAAIALPLLLLLVSSAEMVGASRTTLFFPLSALAITF